MLRRIMKALAFPIALLASPQAAHAACTAADTAFGDAGRWTSGQMANGQATSLTRSAGLHCSGALLTLISDNYVIATIHSANDFQLRRAGAPNAASYVASVTPDGTRPIPQDGSVNYADRTLLGLLGLGNATDVSIPISFVSFKGSGLITGTYSDTVTIRWRWKVCNGVNLLTLICLGYSEGSATTTYTLSMDVNGLPPIVTIATMTVYDPIRRTTNPLAIPGSRQITTISVHNPDVVPLDPDTLAIELPTTPQQTVSLDPVEGQTAAVQLVQGAEDGMACRYGGAGDTTDDVEYSDGSSWSFQPVSGAQIKSTRIRIRGSLKPSKSVSVTVGRNLL
jgi:hypothetical protein